MYVFIALFTFVAFAYMTRKNYPKIRGVYSQDHGLWYGVKFVIALAVMSFRSAVHRFNRRANSKHSEQGDWESPDDFVKNDKLAMNTWALIGGDRNGNVLLVRMCRRLEGRIEVWLILRLADGRTFTHPVHPDTLVQDETPFGDEFEDAYMAGAAMRFRAIEPVKTFRFSYAGLMRLFSPGEATLATDGFDPKTNTHQPTPSYVEVDIRVWFRALADPAEYGIDGHPVALAASMAREDWSKFNMKRTTSESKTPHHQQSGEMRGYVKIINSAAETLQLGAGNNIEYIPLNLHGMRNRTRGRRDWGAYHSYHAHFGMLDNGVSFSLTVLCNLDGPFTQLLSGFIMEPNGYVYAVSWSDMCLPNFPDSPNNLPVEYEVHFTANGKMYTLKVRRFSSITLPHGEDWQAVIFISPCRFEINGVVGSGNVEYEHNNDGRLLPPKPRPGIDDFNAPKGPGTGLVRNLMLPTPPRPGTVEYPLCASLKEPLCALSSLTGGKAAKLALLVQASKPDVDFIVPDGFALTVGAFDRHVASVPELRSAIDVILAAAGSGYKRGEWRIATPNTQQIQAACDRAVSIFQSTPLAAEIKDAIRRYMHKTFGNDWQNVFVAVRSSAVGEDGAEASAAGQMETHLHIQGESAIDDAVRKCWASNFDFRAIQYRRQICSKLDPSMGVLIQRLVPAETAGVLFTRDPANGSMARLIINASFGIGEDVVSGAVEPDTITVNRYDFIDSDRFDVVYSHIGGKRRALSDVDSHGQSERHCCLSEENVKRLAKIGITIERIFGSARDIEWAISSDDQATADGKIGKTVISILQARPITTMDSEEDWELEHEFDTPLGSDREWITTANVREMIPGALTPLSAGIYLDLIGSASDHDQVWLGIKPWRRINVSRQFSMFYQQPFFNCSMVSYVSEMGKRSMEMAIFGEIKPELPSLEEMQSYVDNTSSWWHRLSTLSMQLGLLRGYSSAVRFQEELNSKVFTPHACEPDTLYQQIVDTLPLMRRGWLELIRVCNRPIASQIFLMSLLNPDFASWSAADVSDLSTLLSSCPDVYTIDVPKHIRSIADAITRIGARDEFLEMDNKAAVAWLLSTKKVVAEPSRTFKAFLQKHGHRCVRESELREKCWRQAPEKVIEAIKAILGAGNLESGANKPSNKQELSVDEAINAINKPITGFKRKIMRWILPIARNSVGRREWGKSLAIQSMEACRVACHRLGVILTERGYLPDDDLVFFLTLYELGQLIKRRSAKLIFKALRRRRLISRLMDMEFDELVKGYPEPVPPELPLAANVSADTHLILNGIPIGNGFVEGTARVLSSFAEAHLIKNGEILIVPYTDVGWTPYFPLISGLVTELGGLLSHGAVVAREYGLPCLVGCKRATRLIPNGARVRIDAKSAQVIVLGSNEAKQ